MLWWEAEAIARNEREEEEAEAARLAAEEAEVARVLAEEAEEKRQADEAAEVARLRADLHDHTKDHIINRVDRNTGTIDQLIDDSRAEIDRMNCAKAAFFLAGCGAHRAHYVCICHGVFLLCVLLNFRCTSSLILTALSWHSDARIEANRLAIEVTTVDDMSYFLGEFCRIT